MSAESSRESLERTLLEMEGKAPLEEWLLFLLEPHEVRSLVRRFALKLKGFRVEKAPLRDLGQALARGLLKLPRLRSEILDRLSERGEGELVASPPPAPEETDAPDESARKWEDLCDALRVAEARKSAFEAEVKALSAKLETARGRAEEGGRRAEEAEGKLRKLTGQLQALRDLAPKAKEALKLEKELESLEEENHRLRANCALLHQQVNELEVRLSALEEERRKRSGKKAQEPADKPPPFPAEGAERALIPFLTQEFLEALQGYPDAQIQRILHAVFLACLNLSYSSLNIKKLEGKGDIWSVRAGISLRLFFLRQGKVLRFVMVADREDQDTILHTLRERYA